VLRRELAVDPQLGPYLEVYLASGGTAEGLETLLYRAHQLRARWGAPFDPARLAEAIRAYARLTPPALDLAVATGVSGRSVNAVRDRLRPLHEAARRFERDGDLPRFLAAADVPVAGKDALCFALDRIGPKAPELGRLVGELADAAVPLDTAVAQMFLPSVAAKLETRKRTAGLYDFDDMLKLVADALTGPGGAELAAELGSRFKLAIVDEFQDTDPIQWEIFRALFRDGGGRPLYLVGDPKQAIYGFRGADVATYAAACATIAAPGDSHRLTRNFRSTPAVIDAYNAILDQSAAQPFFYGGVTYDVPVAPGRLGDDEGAAPITLLRVTAEEDVERLPMRAVRDGLARAIAEEIAALLAEGPKLHARDIFVLTRTWREAAAVSAALAARGVPAVLYNQEGLYTAPEARQVRDLLRAVADPRDPAKRLRAWLTPFFGLTLADLPAAAGAEGDHPLHARLYAWHAAAAREPLGRIYGRILEESGVLLRELFLGESARRMVNLRHLFEVLAAEDARAPRPLGDVVRRLSALCDQLVVPAPEEGNVQRAESDRDAVQIMTMHKAKGLEAEVVFLYGGYSPSPNRGVRLYTDGGARLAIAGRPRRTAVTDLIKRERESEDQRLFYVALTRARRRLYLPFSPGAEAEEQPLDGGVQEDRWKINGGYLHVNRRLRALRADPGGGRHFETRDVPIDPRAARDAARPQVTLPMLAWRPDTASAPLQPDEGELGRLRAARLGPTLTSYSRIKHSEGGYRPPTEIHDETAVVAAPADDELPGGARAGVFVHDLLEQIPLAPLREAPDLEIWMARPEVAALLETVRRRHGREPRQLRGAARLAHAALTVPLPVVGGTLPGLGHAARVAREMEFLFPFPGAAGGADRGYVKGFVDVLFEHEGRVYFGDWKTDRLPAWDAAAVEAHVAQNYGLQEQLYALALVRMLGITDEAAYEARFGGTLYIFVRGLPGAVRSRRPSFDELRLWEAEIAERLASEEVKP